jgi:hypothetical protein
MDITCVLAALFFFTGNLILLIVYAKENGRDHYDLDQYKDLNPDYIQEEWKFRVKHRAPYLAAGLVNGLAWFCLAFPILQLCWILSFRGTRRLWLHVMVAILTLCGSFTEWISRFLYIGSSMATQLLVKEFQLDHWYSSNSNDGIGWRVLEVTHIVTSGLIWFIDAFEWLALFCIMTLLHISVRHWRTWDTADTTDATGTDSCCFGACWNAVGLFIALLSLLDFVAEVLRLDGFKTFGTCQKTTKKRESFMIFLVGVRSVSLDLVGVLRACVLASWSMGVWDVFLCVIVPTEVPKVSSRAQSVG